MESEGDEIHWGGNFWVYDIERDEFCLLDFVKDIFNHCGFENARVQWWKNGALATIESDKQLLEMWDHIVVQNSLYHLYVLDFSGSGSQQPPLNKTPPKKTLPKKTPPKKTPTKKLVLSDDEDDWAFRNLLEQQWGLRAGGHRSQEDRAEFEEQQDVPEFEEQQGRSQSEEEGRSEVNNLQLVEVLTQPALTFEGSLQQNLLEGLDAEETYHSGKSDSEVEHDFDWGVEDEHVETSQQPEVAEQQGEGTQADEQQVGQADAGTQAEFRSENLDGRNSQGNDFDKFYEETRNLYEDEDREELEQQQPRDKPQLELYKKMQWPTMGDCRKWMRNYALQKKFEYLQIKNDNLIIQLVCKSSKCDWFVYVRKLPHSHTAMLRRFKEDGHTCESNKKGKNCLANARWIANKMEQFIRNHKDLKPKNIMDQVWEVEGVRISYWTAWQAKVICHEKIYGSYAEGYRMCPELASHILAKNPGSLVQWLRDPFDKSFVSFVVGFKGALDGFVKGCRPIIGLDGCFLKGKYGGMVLAATSLDGNNGLFPIAMCVANGETYDSWSRFLSFLAPYVKQHKDPLTFISDRGKGLIAAVQSVFPNAHHRFCFRHMYKNFKGDGFKGPHLEDLSWGAAKAYKKEDFDKWMATIAKDDDDAFKWLQKEPVECWARSHFDTTSKAEHITNNFSESFNKMILNLREMPLVKLNEQYQLLVMGLLYQRKKDAEGMPREALVPRVLEKIEGLKKNYNKYTVEGSTDFLHVAINKWGATWTVNLDEHTCTCCEWQITGIPCIHAIAVIMPRREPWSRYCSPYLTWGKFADAYESYVTPIENSQYWPNCDIVVKPPPLYRPPGRPKTGRMKGKDELPKGPKNAPKKCSKCGEIGHNMRSCKGAANVDQNGRRVKRRTAAEGPSLENVASTSSYRPPLIVPSAPVLKATSLRGNKRKGSKKKAVFKPPARPTL